MATFYGLHGYLTVMHYAGTVLLWGGWLALLVLVPAGLLCRRRRRAARPHTRGRGMREYIAPLGLVLLGASLLCAPGWRWLDGVLSEVDIAIIGCVFHNLHGGNVSARGRALPSFMRNGDDIVTPVPAAGAPGLPVTR